MYPLRALPVTARAAAFRIFIRHLLSMLRRFFVTLLVPMPLSLWSPSARLSVTRIWNCRNHGDVTDVNDSPQSIFLMNTLRNGVLQSKESGVLHTTFCVHTRHGTRAVAYCQPMKTHGKTHKNPQKPQGFSKLGCCDPHPTHENPYPWPRWVTHTCITLVEAGLIIQVWLCNQTCFRF